MLVRPPVIEAQDGELSPHDIRIELTARTESPGRRDRLDWRHPFLREEFSGERSVRTRSYWPARRLATGRSRGARAAAAAGLRRAPPGRARASPTRACRPHAPGHGPRQ